MPDVDPMENAPEIHDYLVEHFEQVVFQIGPDSTLTFLNSAWGTLVGHPVGESLGRPLAAFVHQDDRDGLSVRLRAMLDGAEDSCRRELRLSHHDGSVRRAELRAATTGRHVCGTLVDLTDRRIVEGAALAAEVQLDAAFDGAAIGMALTAPDGRFLRVNRALCALVGYDEADLLAEGLPAIVHPDHRADQARGMKELLDGGVERFQAEQRFVRGDGDGTWVEVNASATRDADGNPLYVVCHFQDITERRALEDSLRHLADHDALTGLCNRRRFEEEVERHVAHGQRYGVGGALLVLDLDGFKRINDTYGHRAGDRVLTSVAGVLAHRLRQTDILARLGGDEFAVLLPEADRADAMAVAMSLAEALRRDVVVPEEGEITASIGIALLATGVASADDVLIAADSSMYEAKAAGGDGVAPAHATIRRIA
jgi:diguanylate cyclase (GGDEF)-like protein/PAS domain S-box-containing protein